MGPYRVCTYKLRYHRMYSTVQYSTVCQCAIDAFTQPIRVGHNKLYRGWMGFYQRLSSLYASSFCHLDFLGLKGSNIMIYELGSPIFRVRKKKIKPVDLRFHCFATQNLEPNPTRIKSRWVLLPMVISPSVSFISSSSIKPFSKSISSGFTHLPNILPSLPPNPNMNNSSLIGLQ